MITRVASIKLKELSLYFKAIALIGPRQSGKTTLVKMVFPDKPYVSLENPDTRYFAINDPRGFLNTYKDGAIFDEVQRVPELFSYLQEILDNSKETGQFILTGSNNFMLQENITQSLAGRIGYLTLLPFSISEMPIKSDFDIIFNGCYPPIYDQNIPAVQWYKNYINTYIERDVRQIKAISDLFVYERFMRLLAGRTGQELNYASLAQETGVDAKTIQSWISILESSFIIYLLKPYYRNYNKTIIKRPKVYFYDTGLVCSLLGIQNQSQIDLYPLKGALYENMVVMEIIKQFSNQAIIPTVYYWRDKTGREVDIIIEKDLKIIPIEIKSSQTIKPEFTKHLVYWKNLASSSKAYVLYAGNVLQNQSSGVTLMNWRNFSINKI
jgi:uncharacterized protein